MHSSALPLRPQRGSALATVLMISIAFMIIVASTLTYSLTERRLNHRKALRLEVRNAAEAVSEYGLAQVQQKMESRSSFTSTRFTSASVGSPDAVTLPASTFWGGSNVTSGSPELIVGLIAPVTTGTSSSLYYYDPTDPNNEFDPLKGRYAFRFDIRVLSKATVTPATTGAGGPQTCYMTQTLSARASPLFSHAMFYNMDLEIWPGPAMNILGGVHTNGSLYAKKQSSSGLALNFIGPVTVAGGVYAGVKCSITNYNGTLDNLSGYTDNVYYSTAAGGLIGMKDTATGRWRDHKWGATTETATTQASFRTWAAQTYTGNLMSRLHGVTVCNPPGISTYVEDPTPANGQDNSVNDAHKIIEPPLASTDTDYDSEVESQKYSTRAAIYICVNPTSSTRNGRKPDGTVISIPAKKYRVFLHKGTSIIEITLPGQQNYGANNATANTNANAGGPAVITIRENEMYDMRRTTYRYGTARSATNPYTLKQITCIDLDMAALKLAVNKTINGLTTSTGYLTATPADGTATSNAAWTQFIYNPSASPSTTLPLTTAHNIIDTTTNLPIPSGIAPTAYWNGAIYIESIDANQTPKLADFTTDNINYRNGGTNNASVFYTGSLAGGPSGVRLINGRGLVANDNVSGGLGLTIATNDAVYVLGHFNADGTINTATSGTTNSGRYPESNEAPVSICCDALTILSTPGYTLTGSPTVVAQTMGHNDQLSSYTNSTSSWVSTWATSAISNSNYRDGKGTSDTAVKGYRCPYDNTTVELTGGTARRIKYPGNHTEIAAAFLAGIVVSNKDNNGQNCGGANNYPRFNEDFSASGTQTTVAIRGSIVAMYESRAATEPWNWRTFSAPIRLWGFNQLFADGRFPPLTPRVMSYRRVDFNDIDRTTYNAVKASWGL